eukprot:913802-Prorocentrum_minimum.AAC.4
MCVRSVILAFHVTVPNLKAYSICLTNPLPEVANPFSFLALDFLRVIFTHLPHSKQYQPAHKPTHHWPCAMTAGAAGRRTGGSGRASPGARALGEASGRRSLHRLPVQSLPRCVMDFLADRVTTATATVTATVTVTVTVTLAVTVASAVDTVAAS